MSDTKRISGFTLVELLVVIGIIALLGGLILPQILKSGGRGQIIQCMNNLKNIGLAAQDYMDDDDTHIYPWAGEEATATESLNLLVTEGYIKEPELFVCPSAKGKSEAKLDDEKNFSLTPTNNCYAWSKKMIGESDEASTIVGCDGAIKDGEGDNNHPDGLNILRRDNAVKFTKFKKNQEKKLPDEVVQP